ncbi:hypothetical protein Ocin01_10291 [Orchesella cincta]|uniref:Uncharacterized protein n=1 Tax=Orchesella cincta TaxID=48709 RepID=A0A1D2MTY6_ORCCI|nr:hypothetical protein Ocin01_10291 [Orchesella cincta]
MRFRLCFCIVLVTAVVLASAKKNKKDGNKEKNPGQSKKGLQNLSLCLGEPVALNVQPESVDECLTAKFNEIIATFGNSTDEKSTKKLAKKKQKLSKKLKKKCMTECEWKVVGLIPSGEGNSTGNTSSTADSTEKFSKMFPEAAQAEIKNAIESCLNTQTKSEIRKGANINKANQMCSQNKRITKCLQKSLNRACRGKGRQGGTATSATTTTQTPAVGSSTTGTPSSPSSVSSSSSSPVSTVRPSIAPDDDTGDDDNDDDDDDDDLDKDDDEDNDLSKTSPSSPSLNTAKPITK